MIRLEQIHFARAEREEQNSSAGQTIETGQKRTNQKKRSKDRREW